jgi:hypothetical protein
MHGSVTICGQVLMGADTAPLQYESPRGISLALHVKGSAEGERIFGELAVDGTNVVPMEKTFWAERFGVVIDRFGITGRLTARLSRIGALVAANTLSSRACRGFGRRGLFSPHVFVLRVARDEPAFAVLFRDDELEAVDRGIDRDK